MSSPDPGALVRFLSPAKFQYQRAEGGSRAGVAAERSEGTLDAPEHSGTMFTAIGSDMQPVVALFFCHSVIFTLNQYISQSVGRFRLRGAQ